jgi:hypothetical protein
MQMQEPGRGTQTSHDHNTPEHARITPFFTFFSLSLSALAYSKMMGAMPHVHALSEDLQAHGKLSHAALRIRTSVDAKYISREQFLASVSCNHLRSLCAGTVFSRRRGTTCQGYGIAISVLLSHSETFFGVYEGGFPFLKNYLDKHARSTSKSLVSLQLSIAGGNLW